MASADADPRPDWRDAFSVYLKARVLIVLFLGFSAGLPLALSGSTLLVWMSEADVNLRTIGLFAFVGTPYTLKFLWAPLVDALDAPVLSKLLGRRRGWLVLTQLMLIVAIIILGSCDPFTVSPLIVACGALLVSTASATQDIVIDAFRVESLDENEQAAGMASYVAAYRVGMLISTAGALFLVSYIEKFGIPRSAAWTTGYIIMAMLVVVGIITTIIATEPPKSKAVEAEHAKISPFARVLETAASAFSEFLSRDLALFVLIFVVLFKFTDALAGAMTPSFVIKTGFSRDEYAAIIKGVGFAATILGGFAGGFIARAYPLATCLWIGGIIQSLANLAFSWQAVIGYDIWMLTAAITIENFTSAVGTVFFVAYLSNLCRNPLHTATQYALLTALAAVGRTYMSAGAGFIAEATGWVWFFVICAAAGIPSLILLAWLQARGHFKQFETHTRK
jgi:MFS transporter, PAT family, beta-lactamase induction signal transducer AmpG